VLAILACCGLKVHLTISERNDPTRQRLGGPWDQLRRLLYPRADLVTANSRSAIEALATFVPGHKLAYLPNPVRQPRDDDTAPGERPFVLNIGRLTTQKAQDVLIDGFALFADDNPDWDLAIIGEGPLGSALIQQADRLGLAGRVKFIGRTEDPFPYYRAAAIFALPSRHEGLPNVLLEAMTCAVACIISETSGGALEYVTDGISGLVIPSDNADALCKALLQLAAAPALRRRLGEAGQERVSHLTGPEVSEIWKRTLGLVTTAK
jgi:glycosyltransferase involved in cell wall biosynthesis